MKNVLIFEDDPEQRRPLMEKLRNQGYTVHPFSLPSQALKAVTEGEFSPDLALLDIKLDVISTELLEAEEAAGFSGNTAGIELASRLLAIKKIPIIFLTAYADTFDLAKEIRPDAFLDKGSSINEQAVVNAVQLALQNFYISPDYKPKLSALPKGKVCLSVRPYNASIEKGSDAFRKAIISIEDILFFGNDPQQKVLHLHVKGHNRPLRPTIASAVDLLRQIQEIMHEKNIEDPFVELFRGRYVNINNIVSFDSGSVYFDVNSDISIPINLGAHQHLLEIFPPIRN